MNEKSRFNFCMKSVSILIIVTYSFVTNLWGLDFARAEEVPIESTEVQAESSDSPESLNSDNFQQLTPEQAEQVQVSALKSSESSAPISFNSLQAFQADPFTGSASYAIPIVVPPGRNGIQPNISLTYSSTNGNGICGVGWDLELGSIERSTKNGAPTYNNSEDTFIFKSGGSVQELVDIGGGHYRAKTESNFLDFYFSSQSYWIIRDKSRKWYFLGQNTPSRIEAAQGTFRWAIDKVVDSSGNYMTINYMKESNQIYPLEIKYTGLNDDGAFPHGIVNFVYFHKDDIQKNYRPRVLVTTQQRLSDIIVKDASGAQIRKYHINYTNSPSTNRSLLSSITQLDSTENQALPALIFNYQQAGSGWTRSYDWNIPSLAILDQ